MNARTSLLIALLVVHVASIAQPGPSFAAPADVFAIKSVSAGESTNQAGLHPDLTTDFEFEHELFGGVFPRVENRLEDASFFLPPGLIGNPQAIPRCSSGAFLIGNCPVDSQIGVVDALLTYPYSESTQPLFNLEPTDPQTEIARFGFSPVFPVFISVKIRTAGDFGVTATVEHAPSEVSVVGGRAEIWGNPPDPSHDTQRLTVQEGFSCPDGTACEAPGGKRSSGLPPTVFITNSSACQEQSAGFRATSYQLPGVVLTQQFPMPTIEGCVGLPFEPSLNLAPTSAKNGAPTGLSAHFDLPQIEETEEKGTATMREARVTLPEGMGISAAAANGIDSCSAAQVGVGEEVDAQCPDASKLGAVAIGSPALPDVIEGALYLRTPEPGHLFRLWLVVDELGLHVKLPGEIEANRDSGQLTAVFQDLPQVPVGNIEFEVRSGPRAPLKNPDACGTYFTQYTFRPWSDDPPVSGESKMTIDEACDRPAFAPTLQGGVLDPIAGAFSPLVLDIVQREREPNLGDFEVTLPKGQLAKIAGVPLCPDSAAASGACPPESRIGSVAVENGPGPQPLTLPQPGKKPTAMFFAGPYKGAPFSVVTTVPAQAGPFDLGTVAIRSALYVDSETGVARMKTDPLPQFLEGVPVIYRRIHAVVDRPQFSLNPTNCTELEFKSLMSSVKGDIATPRARFEVDGCKALKFAPKLRISLRGGTKRGDYPALEAVLRMKAGGANIRRASVALPRSEFLAQEHIKTICTRVQFAADSCPKGSVYGMAMAWTPLLDEPLKGPVYLRSSNHPLPDLVVALDGQLDIDVVGRIDSKNGGIRTTFEAVPDAPISKFLLRMRGGRQSLLVNSRDICASKNRATVRMEAQNGRRFSSTPVVRGNCGEKK